MEISKGKVGNALTSVAKNHVLAVAADIYDEKHDDYQENINGRVADRSARIVDGAVQSMGYRILEKNASFKEQVENIANTIFEVRDNFDLGGAAVTLSENCVLKFEGGKLSNGTLRKLGVVRNGSFADDIVVESFANNISNLRASDYGVVADNGTPNFNSNIISTAVNNKIAIEFDGSPDKKIYFASPIIVKINGAIRISGTGHLYFPNSSGIVLSSWNNGEEEKGIAIKDSIIDGISITSLYYCIDFSNNNGEVFPTYIYKSVFSNLNLSSEESSCIYGGYKKKQVDVITFDLLFQNIKFDARDKNNGYAFEGINGTLKNRVDNVNGTVRRAYFKDFVPEVVQNCNYTYGFVWEKDWYISNNINKDPNTGEYPAKGCDYCMYLSEKHLPIQSGYRTIFENCNFEDFLYGVLGSNTEKWYTENNTEITENSGEGYINNINNDKRLFCITIKDSTIFGGVTALSNSIDGVYAYEHLFKYPFLYFTFEGHLGIHSKVKTHIKCIGSLATRNYNNTPESIFYEYTERSNYNNPIPQKTDRVLTSYVAGFTSKTDGICKTLLRSGCYNAEIFRLSGLSFVTAQIVSNNNENGNVSVSVTKSNVIFGSGFKKAKSVTIVPENIHNGIAGYIDYIGPIIMSNESTNDIISHNSKWILKPGETGLFVYFKEGADETMFCVSKTSDMQRKDGSTELRPSNINAGYQYFDTTLGKPIWWNGTAWVDSTGATV